MLWCNLMEYDSYKTKFDECQLNGNVTLMPCREYGDYKCVKKNTVCCDKTCEAMRITDGYMDMSVG